MSDCFEYKVTAEDTGEIFTLHLKPSSRIPFGIIEEIWAGDKPAATMMLNWALSDEERAITKRVCHPDITKMIEVWQEDGVSLGESAASPASSKTANTARRSKPTSSDSDSD